MSAKRENSILANPFFTPLEDKEFTDANQCKANSIEQPMVHLTRFKNLQSSEEETPQIEYEADPDDFFKVAALCHSLLHLNKASQQQETTKIDAFPSSNQDLGT